MRFLVFLAPSGFRDESFRMLELFFNKWGIERQVTSYTKTGCTGDHGSVCKPDIHTSKVSTFGYDGLLMVDGPGIEKYKLYEYRPLLDLAYSFYNNGKFVWAIGNAIKIAARANIVKGKRVSTPQDQDVRSAVLMFHGIPSSAQSEVQERLCTIGSPSDLETAIPEVFLRLGVK